jgi:phage terminase large subunit GpA-like protein
VRYRALCPPPALTVSQWADRHRVVPSYSAEPGPWVTTKTPYLREIMDSVNDPTVNRVVFMKCSRIGATEAGLNIIGYFIHQDPSHVFIVQPTVDDAKDFSKEQLTPSIEETDVLRERVKDQKSRDSGNTVMAKVFPGGALYLVGANSPRGFRRRTARVVVLEEVDGYPPSAGTEGDQVKLAERRATTYQHRRKVYINSSPTLKDFSRIEKEFARSDQRHYHVPCPDCGAAQALRWDNLRWDGEHDPPQYLCTVCGVLIPEREKFRMVANGRWVAKHPGRATRGYHINALYSPWVSWAELRDEWVEAQGDEGKLQVFKNTALGETWEYRAGGMSADVFESRREAYPAEVPAGVHLLTCGVDVQEDRLEAVVRGWGPGMEAWFVARVVLFGDPTIPEQYEHSPWRALKRDVMDKAWQRADGKVLRVKATAIDSGYQPEAVHRFGKPRYGRGVYVTRGASKPGTPMLPKRPSRNNKARCPVFHVGTDAAKDELFGMLRTTLPGPRYWHFSVDCDRDYFDQLTAEKAEKAESRGRTVRRYVKIGNRRNEVLDCELGNLLALHLASASFSCERDTGTDPQSPAPPPQDPAPEGVVTAPRNLLVRPRAKGFVSGWK